MHLSAELSSTVGKVSFLRQVVTPNIGIKASSLSSPRPPKLSYPTINLLYNTRSSKAMIICNTDIFESLTKGGEYEIIDTDADLVIVKNNAGQQRAYHASWFY